MSVTSEFYFARATESAQAARDASLDNVKERCLRAEKAWLAMATRLVDAENRKRRDATVDAE